MRWKEDDIVTFGFAYAGKDPITNLQDHLANPWVNNFATVRFFPTTADLTHCWRDISRHCWHLSFSVFMEAFCLSRFLLLRSMCHVCVLSHIIFLARRTASASLSRML